MGAPDCSILQALFEQQFGFGPLFLAPFVVRLGARTRKRQQLLQVRRAEVQKQLSGNRFHRPAFDIHADPAAFAVDPQLREWIRNVLNLFAESQHGALHLGGRHTALAEPHQAF
jgi:hypothetical protein